MSLNLRRRRHPVPTIPIVSLIDIMVVLLIFFVATTTFKKQKTQMQIALPQSKGEKAALDPEVLFLDEPTAGLDPDSASAFDELVLDLRDSLGLTVVMVTHDLDTLWRTADRVAFLGERRVIALDTMRGLCGLDHPLVKSFFDGPRGRAARECAWKSG